MRRRSVLLAVLLLAPVLLPTPSLPAAESIADDGRAGSVLDLAGSAFVRPVGRDRFSPLSRRSLLRPGDLVRLSPVGAHAVSIRLAGNGHLLLGPGTEVEIVSRDSVRLVRGEMEVAGRSGSRVTVTGPGGFSALVTGPDVLKVEGDEVRLVDAVPAWITGYRASTTGEWMGSLLADVDGRNVPLSVGSYRVEVVLRDQIAETTITQTFVSPSSHPKEGVFTFPLPPDASISGFGMWIEDEYVEADIVERRRARAIYEDIKRRRKDPGLLEWSGGNLFTARVFPIRSEKKIRIRFTQVLPLEGDSIRYRHALRSELLRNHPVRDISIRLTVDSALPIQEIASPTHPCRVRKTGHAATLEFDAEQFRPDRDFEARITLGQVPPLVAIPHLRGRDGTFLLLVTPPGAGSGSRRLTP